MNTRRRPEIRQGEVATCYVLFALAMAYFALSFPYSLSLHDEGYFSVLSAFAAAGSLPHRDFSDFYGPGIYWLNGGLLGVSGGQLLSVKLGIAIVKASSVVLTYGLVRDLVSRRFAVFGALLAILFWGRPGWPLNTAYAAIYVVPLCMASCLLIIRGLDRGTRPAFLYGGVIAGCALLFKHSLALLCIGGLGVAIWCVSLLEANSRGGARSDLVWGLLPLGAAAGAILVPFSSMMGVRDYLIHFVPFHVLLGVVGVATVRGSPRVEVWRIVTQRLAPFAVGAALAPAGVLGVYAALGGLEGLINDLFVVPLRMENYYMPTRTPAWDAAMLVGGVFAMISGSLLALGGRRVIALVAMALGLAAVGISASRQAAVDTASGESIWPWLDSRHFDEVFGPAVVLAAALGSASLLAKQPDSRAMRRVLPILFLSSQFLFQAFPRGGYSSYVVEAAIVPALVWVLFRWRQLGLSAGSSAFQRAVATLLVLLIPLGMAGHAAAPDGPLRQLGVRRRVLDLPGTTGIMLDDALSRVLRIDQVEALIAHLADLEPKDAPVLLLGNSWLIVFLSERPLLFPKRSLQLILVGWEMLGAADLMEMDEAAMLERVRVTPNLIVIQERGPESRRFQVAFPELAAFIGREFTDRTWFDPYVVLRRAPR